MKTQTQTAENIILKPNFRNSLLEQYFKCLKKNYQEDKHMEYFSIFTFFSFQFQLCRNDCFQLM